MFIILISNANDMEYELMNKKNLCIITLLFFSTVQCLAMEQEDSADSDHCVISNRMEQIDDFADSDYLANKFEDDRYDKEIIQPKKSLLPAKTIATRSKIKNLKCSRCPAEYSSDQLEMARNHILENHNKYEARLLQIYPNGLSVPRRVNESKKSYLRRQNISYKDMINNTINIDVEADQESDLLQLPPPTLINKSPELLFKEIHEWNPTLSDLSNKRIRRKRYFKNYERLQTTKKFIEKSMQRKSESLSQSDSDLLSRKQIEQLSSEEPEKFPEEDNW